MDKAALLVALCECGVELNQAAQLLFEDPRFTPLTECEDVDVACASVATLGFEEGATYDQLMARARESGLAECPLELGPHLRLQFLHQPEGPPGHPVTRKLGRAAPGSITVASRPLDDRDETPKGFYLRRIDGVLWLRGYWSWAGHICSPEDVFVFSRKAL
jgi:hypothetical protein